MRVLCLIDAYLPGYKFGGQIRTLANLVEALGNKLQLWIFTRDRDFGDAQAYPDVAVDQWKEARNCRVFYASTRRFGWVGLCEAIRASRPDVVYVNGLYSRMTIRFLVARRLGAWTNVPVIIAPRGELSPAAVSLKSYKKAPFLRVASRLGLFRGILWQASTALEAKEIGDTLGWCGETDVRDRIMVAPDLTIFGNTETCRPRKAQGSVKFVFLSRISAKKNLSFAIRALGQLDGQISLDVFGPIGDPAYWTDCRRIASAESPGLALHHHGTVAPDKVGSVFGKYDFFIFPTLGENFGHVILESLAAGTPVILSDTTPWRDLEARGAGWCIALGDRHRWREVLAACVRMDQAQHLDMQRAALKAAAEYSVSGNAADVNFRMFHRAHGWPKRSEEKDALRTGS